MSHALMLKEARDSVILPYCDKLISELKRLAKEYQRIPMMARTHGQPASPTTMGKEMANVMYRLQRQRDQIANVTLLGKVNGAVGNYNAHISAYPNVDWANFADEFVSSLGVTLHSATLNSVPLPGKLARLPCPIKLTPSTLKTLKVT